MRLGLIGYPLDHSLSSVMQSAALNAAGLDWTYRNLPVSRRGLSRQVEELRAPDWRGANVTLPHKAAVLPLLDEVDPVARAVGVVNCVTNEAGRLVGSNTDVAAFQQELDKLQMAWQRKPAWILGAGGAARACAFALLQRRAAVTVICRRPQQGEDLAANLQQRPGASLRLRPWSSPTLAEAPRNALIVNATPLGMWPNAEVSPWPDHVQLPPQATIFDIVYNPPVTALLRRSRAAGLEAVNGMGMLVEQGALAFERWTDRAAPRRTMRQAVDMAMEVQDAQILDSG
jgi:shikimate dehydrogenase